ncbi:hypothetical protein MUCCIDRAFT_112811 [Mucor lusitanicus CBS 277.49]|uniref:Uncharacterized protein n=1 Tax=Mucor lusitanicus CBS 277.49 TaxID=747725 RepID=A0A168JLY8_MUCCL|nr:hypothetical protein MUCCIDRAFT_112811 [Mucor lusitanicus CBS 277.49]
MNNRASNPAWMTREENLAKSTPFQRKRHDETMDRCHCVMEDEEDDEFVSIGVYNRMDDFRYPKVFIFDKKSRRNIHVQVHKLMANTFLHDDFTEERNIIDHINSDKNKNRLSNLRIVTTAKNNLFSHGVFVLAIDKRTKEETLFPSINHCAAAFFSLYPNLRSYLQRHLEYETVTHLFYRDLPAKYRRGEKFYVDTE